ncbi:MAG: hypothetical protein QOK10_3654 [Pseudonocardiales bacterium]|jgi:RNA polymerase sigma-70 factor (sigma-E family)|nr:hypothetical protein [Pseudonocardiales bacterium]
MQVDEELSSLVRDRGQHLVRVAYQLTHDRSTAEDLVQEALFQVCRSWRTRRGQPDRLEAYVRRAMMNVYLKRQRGKPLLPDAELAEQSTDGAFDKHLADRDEIWRSLEQLPMRQRAVLVLRFYEDLPDSEIARLLSCRQSTVRSLAARGLTALRTHVGYVIPLSKEGQR